MASDIAADAMHAQPPTKGRFAAYMVCWVLGVGCLLPWNSMLTVQDYYTSIFPRYHPSRVLTLVYQPFALVLLGAFSYFGDKINIRLRILIGYVLFVFCSLAIPILDLSTSNHGIRSFLGICIVSIGFGIAIAHVQGMVGELSYMLPEFVQAFVAGMSASGVATSILRVITKALFPTSGEGLRKGALTFFFVAALFEILCMALYAFVFPRLQVVRYYHATITHSSDNFIEEGKIQKKIEHQLSGTQIFVGAMDYAVGLFFISALTFSIFPGFLAEDTGKHQLGTWYVVLLIATYNCGDFISRYMPFISFLKLESRKGLLCGSAARCIFVPIFYFATKYGNQTWLLFSCFCLGLSNGYFIVCILMEALKGYKGMEKNILGNILTFCMMVGVFFGVILDWLWLIGKGW